MFKKNGRDFGHTFGDVWTVYVEKYLATMEFATYDTGLKHGRGFLKDLMSVPMVELTAEFISEYMAIQKEKALRKEHLRRYSFDRDLKVLKAFLNWYRENFDSMFVNPILKRHKKEGFIRELPKRKKKMRRHELRAFFAALGEEGSFWRDFAEVQFYFSARVQEVAGLQWESVDFVDGEIEIENVAVWDQKKNFCTLKNTPKNGEDRKIPMTEKLFKIFQSRLAYKNPSTIEDGYRGGTIHCDFVFQIDGRPLKYREIQYRYNSALKKAGLGGKFSATHILRHSMANLVRERMGIEHAQAVGGWKTRHLVEHVYTERPAHLNKDAIVNIEDFMGVDDDHRIPKKWNK